MFNHVKLYWMLSKVNNLQKLLFLADKEVRFVYWFYLI